MTLQLHALYIRGPQTKVFELADALGFETEIEALAVSIFEDSSDGRMFHLQALYQTAENAETALANLDVTKNLECFITQLPDEDWVTLSQKGLPPVEAGRFWVYGAHDADNIPENCPWPIHIEAGQAFGTGHHGTTKGCLLIFDEILKNGKIPSKILDLGCGAGTLAIAAAKALATPIIATDIDPDAVAVTIDNAKQNAVENLISTYPADGFESDVLKDQKFDLIFANILAGPLMELAPDIASALSENGHVILSGILDEQADKVMACFMEAGITTKKGPSLSGWTSLLGSMRELTL